MPLPPFWHLAGSPSPRLERGPSQMASATCVKPARTYCIKTGVRAENGSPICTPISLSSVCLYLSTYPSFPSSVIPNFNLFNTNVKTPKYSFPSYPTQRSHASRDIVKWNRSENHIDSPSTWKIPVSCLIKVLLTQKWIYSIYYVIEILVIIRWKTRIWLQLIRFLCRWNHKI